MRALVRQVAQLELQLVELKTARGHEEVSLPPPFHELVEREFRTPSRTLPKNLPREVETHRPKTSCCPAFEGVLREFGRDVSEVPEYVPESFKIIRHARPKFSCGQCETVLKAPRLQGRLRDPMADPGCLRMCCLQSNAITRR